MHGLLCAVFLMTALIPSPPKPSPSMPSKPNQISSPEIASLKNNIHALEDHLQSSRTRQDWWNSLYLNLGWCAISLATIFGIGSLYSQRKASKIEYASRPDAESLAAKNTRLRELLDETAQLAVADAQTDASNASERAGKAEKGAEEAKERAAKAQASLVTAEQHSAEANAKAEGFRLDIARANEGAAQAQAQVAGAQRASAEANKIAESERLARLQLEARLADRIITPDQRLRLTQAFSPLRGQTVDVVIYGDTPETSRTADAVLGCLQSAGLLFNFFHPASGGAAQGVVIGIRADAPEADKQAGTKFVTILGETLGLGVGSADFEKMIVSGTGTGGSMPGAAPVGKSMIRLQLAPK